MKNKFAVALTTVTLGMALFAGTGGTASAAHLTNLSKEDCKNGGFSRFQTDLKDDSTFFKNQGQCIKFVNTGK